MSEATGEPAPVDTLASGLDQLRDALPTMPDEEVTASLRTVEAVARQAHALSLALVGEVESRGLAGQAGFGSTRRLLSGMLGLSRAEARTRVTHAEQVAPRRALTGEPLPPRCPATAAALARGEIGPGQLRVIAQTMAKLPPSTTPAAHEWAEAHLAGWAPSLDPAGLSRLGARVLAWLDPDGPEPSDDDTPAPSGGLRLRDRRAGGISFEGWLDSEHGAALRELIEQLAKPRPAADDIPDPRGVEQRQADALVELCGLARSAEACPDAGGEPPHLTVTLRWSMLLDGLGAAALDYGSFLSAGQARRWACDAKIIPTVLGGASEPLDVGRAQRTVPAAIRRALVVRDGGCAFPGCGRPPRHCSAHHVVHWIDGGPTALGNCVLLCEHHHRVIHQTDWSVAIRAGRTEFTPPAIIDPQQKPLHNPLRC